MILQVWRKRRMGLTRWLTWEIAGSIQSQAEILPVAEGTKWTPVGD